jgi:hypothetical protein
VNVADQNQDQENDPELEAEAEEFLQNLQKLADQWRERLKDPILQSLVQAGRVQISPLVTNLIEKFPPAKTPLQRLAEAGERAAKAGVRDSERMTPEERERHAAKNQESRKLQPKRKKR